MDDDWRSKTRKRRELPGQAQAQAHDCSSAVAVLMSMWGASVAKRRLVHFAVPRLFCLSGSGALDGVFGARNQRGFN